MSPRICHIRIRGRFCNYSIICAHAPTEVADDEGKGRFYDSLERTLDACPSYDFKIIAGDFNTKIGKEEIYRPNIGRHSLHEETMKMANTSHRSSLQDVKTYRGANVDSDHYLSVAHLRAKIKKEWWTLEQRGKRFNLLLLPQEGKRFNLDKLKFLDTRTRYMEQLDEDLRAQRTIGDTNLRWKDCARAMEKNSEKDSRTEKSDPIYLTRNARLLRTRRTKHTNPWLIKSQGETKINRSRKPYSNVSYICNDHEGNLLSEKQRALSHCKCHFNDFINEGPLELGEELGKEDEEPRENKRDEEPPFEDEILDAINRLRCTKAPGTDRLIK
ncbi:uncharacterized protein [Halyomorpha halys]|uniref:uncharacterized protein n=1 Tax=Halyomorpha halys TaxID=286706 RepID=UPI0034D354C0